jgi:hypothetical protein
MKPLTKVFFLLAFFFQSFNMIIAQSIQFNSPQNGNTYTNGYSETAISVYCDYGYSLSTYPPGVVLSNYSKLITHSETLDSRNVTIPNYFYLAPGSYTWRVELWEFFMGESSYRKTAEHSITFYVKHTLSVTNNFGSGSIVVDGNTTLSGSQVNKYIGDNLSVGAIDQSDGTYSRTWNSSGINNSNWGRTGLGGTGGSIFGASSRDYNYTVVSNDNYATIIADLKMIYIVTFQNNFGGGAITVNGQPYSSPTSQFQVVEQNAITASAQGQGLNGIEYTFTQWSDGYPYSYRTFYPSAHSTYTANFIGKPSNSGESINFGSDVGQPIVIYWTDNINSNVTQYQIWRRVKHNGVVGPDTYIGTVSSGVQTFTDYDYLLTSTYSDDLLWYDVRAYYSTEGTYSDPQWSAVYGEMSFSEQNEPIIALEISNELPTQYEINNYPNPFNPTTTINYQLPENGFVTIKVFDILGKEVALLVNENKSAGYYEVNFNGSKLTSGVYIYTIQVNGITQSKKMLLTK